MELYFLRHGIAADVGPVGTGDAGRPLTGEGIAKMNESARGLRRLGIELDALMTSPLLRAQQTAEIVAAKLHLQAEVVEALSPGFDIEKLKELLDKHPSKKRFMFVGHEPDFSTLLSVLTGGSQIQLKKGGLGRVDLEVVEEHAGVLVWLIPPRLLRNV